MEGERTKDERLGQEDAGGKEGAAGIRGSVTDLPPEPVLVTRLVTRQGTIPFN